MIAGRYRLVELVGRGGMGRVWRARDEVLHREVAVKEVLPPHWLAESERDELRLRTLREARTAARLSHPNVVRLYDVVRVDEHPWIVMEYVPSRTLQAVLDGTGPVDPVRAAGIGRALLAALRAAHAAGVLHRDVKPQNVLMAHDGRIMLTDFGLATFEGGDGLTTRPGLVLGSPQFVAPERAAEGVSSVEADLWSLGATLHAAVEGRSPYARSTAMATLAALATEPPDPAPHAGPLTPVLAGLLCRDPGRRIGHDEAERRLLAAERPASRSDTEPPTVVLPVARSAAGATPPPAWPGASDRPTEGAEALPPVPEGVLRVGGGPPVPAPATPDGAASGHRPATAGSDDHATPARAPALLPPRRRWALVGTALGVAAATGIGTALALADHDHDATPLRAPASVSLPEEQPTPPRDDRPLPPPGAGARPVVPPPFPCLRPYAFGDPVTAAPVGDHAGYRPPSGWTWQTGEGWRVAVPVGWLRSQDDGATCFRDPASRRTLSITPMTADLVDQEAFLRAEQRRVVDEGKLPGYEELRLGGVGGRDVGWECRWTTPFGEREHALRLLPGEEAGGWILTWSAADRDWDAAVGQLTVARQSFRDRAAEAVPPT
ncbi:protein kinase domain-containing protein [Micromonospora citrea]|uniref:serine/threonine-protein kinase n=1 Tax=Micromonospora citrea TaxID=47855 RepID=UPI003C3373F2